MKIVIAGAGSVGRHLAKMLTEGYHDITIIDKDETRLTSVSETMDVVTILGNPSSIEILKSAGVPEADLFVAVYPDNEQEINVVSALLAKRLGARKVTARINNDEYLTPENKSLFSEIGIDLLFYPEQMAANEIGNLLKQSDMSEFMDFANGELQLVVFKLGEESTLLNKTPDDLSLSTELLPFRAVAISRGEETIIPQKDTLFKLNDMIFAISRRDSVDELMSYSGKEYINIKRLAILGGGSIGRMVAQQFEKDADFVKIIELRRDRCEALSEILDKTLVINGDGRNSNLLYDEDIKSCDAFVAVTSSSETNILACVAAKKMGVAKVIAEVENIEYINLAEQMGVDSIVNKKLITASRVFIFTLSNKVRTVKWLTGSDAEVIEYVVNPDSKITKAPIKELRFPTEAVIGGVIRGNESFIAVGETVIRPYDRVVVFSLPEAIGKVEKFFD